MKYDPEKNILIVDSGEVVLKNVKFDGKLIAGRSVSFLGNINAKEVILGKGSLVNGIIEAENVVLGAKIKFNEIWCTSAIVQPGCIGKKIKAKKDVKIYRSKIDVVESEGVVFVDNSKLGKLSARKVVAKSEELV